MPNGQVYETRNISDNREDSYAMNTEEVVEVTADWLSTRTKKETEDFAQDSVLVWHTHPSGHIGPSAEDLAAKQGRIRYLVVSMPDGPAVMF